MKWYTDSVKVCLDALQTAPPGIIPAGLFPFEVIEMTGRIYEDILDYLREEYPDESEEEYQRLADVIYKAWIDGVV